MDRDAVALVPATTKPLVVPVAFVVGDAALDLELTAVPDATTADLLAAVAGGTVGDGTQLWVDGRAADGEQPVGELGLRPGSLLSLAPPPTPAGGAVVSLRVAGGVAAGGTIELPPGRWRIGRDPGADVDLSSSTVSAQHADLVVDALGAVTIEDAGSRNGTRIDGRFAAPGAPVDVPPGAMVSMGAVDLVLGPVDAAARRSGMVAFNRPPRPAPTAPPATVEVPEAPPDPPARPRLPVAALVAPVVMGAVMAVLWDPRMALFALLTPVAAVGSWLEDRRRSRNDRRRIDADTAAAVERFAAVIDDAREEERRRRTGELPDPAAVVRRAGRVTSDLWERRPHHPDFLQLRIGIADVAWRPPLGEVRRPAPGVAEALAARAVLPAAPFGVDLRPGRVVGVVGDDRSVVTALLRSLVVQAATLHGPADLRIGVLHDRSREGDWAFARWLPHRVEGDVVTALAAEEHAARLLVVDGDGLTEGRSSPARSLLSGAAGPVAGIVVADDVRRLPAVCTTVVVLEGPDGAGYALDVASGVRTDGVVVGGVIESCAALAARSLAAVQDPEVHDTGASLPTHVSLLDLLGIDASTSSIVDRWRTPSLRAPIGVASDGPLVVDLVADGPHGLVGGTTGSGKSELLRTLVVGLATAASPADLNFVLIDYKGGSAFDAGARLPHTVGLVTDLDEHLGQRALRCLEAELRHRETVLRDAGAADVARCRSLPRLVVVVDEFATLSAELPDFVDALVGIAQRGRSLGVHLLLATQRPAGAVKDNIRANTNLRIALRMQDAADSTDVIDAPTAAAIARHQAGRGYARLGPSEVVAFQTAMVSASSATTQTRHTSSVVVRPLGAPTPVDDARGVVGPTDLERLVDAMVEAHATLGLPAPRRPWPDPLPAVLPLEAVSAVPVVDAPTAVLGLADDPARQTQRPAVWDGRRGNLLLYGIGGSGTSTALSTIVRSLAARHRPEDLHVYVADLGAGELAGSLRELPHVGAAIGAGEPERLRRLVRFLGNELDRRRRSSGDDPAIVVVVDNWSGLVAAFGDDDLMVRDEVERIVADGPALGVWTVIAADHANAVPLSIAHLVASKLVFRTGDRHDLAALGVPAGLVPGAVPGRCVDASTGLEVQVALSTGVEAMPGKRTASPIGALPTDVRAADVVGFTHGDGLPVGIGIGDHALAPVGLVLHPGDHALVLGPPRSGRSTALLTMAAVLAERSDVRVHAVAGRATSPLRAAPGCVARFNDLVLDDGRLHVVLVDDAESVDDSLGFVAGAGERVHVVAAARTDAVHAAYGHWTRDLRRSRLGLVLHAEPEDGALVGASLPRRREPWTSPGRGHLVVDGRPELVQVARP